MENECFQNLQTALFERHPNNGKTTCFTIRLSSFSKCQSDLTIQCVPSAPCYGASLAHLDVYNQNPKLRNTSSIGRTAQIHDYHMLHVAAWPAGVCAWLRILCQFGLPGIKAAEANYIMTQACLAAAIGRKKPAHLREPHPGYVNSMKILMLRLHPVPLQHFAVKALLPLLYSKLSSAGY